MDQERAFQIAKEYANIILEHFDNINKVVLYGSYARGTMREDSDIDIAVIVDSIEGDWLETNAKLYSLRRDIDFRIEPNLLINEEDPSDFLPNVLLTGKIIYDAAKFPH